MKGFRLVSMARLLVLAVFLMLFIALSTTAYAAAVDLSNNLGNGVGSMMQVDNNTWLAQAFTTDATHTRITTVTLPICPAGVTGNFSIEIWNATGAGSTPGSKVADVAVNQDTASLPAAGSRNCVSNVTYSGLSISLNASTTYYVVVRGVSLAGKYLGWNMTNTNTGTGFPSNFSSSTNSGVAWSVPVTTNPQIMQVVADTVLAPVAVPTAAPKEVPEGDTLLLLGGGMSGLGVWLRYQWGKRKKQ